MASGGGKTFTAISESEFDESLEEQSLFTVGANGGSPSTYGVKCVIE